MRKGFSLVELLVVVAIIAALVGVAAPYYADYVKESKISKAKQDLDALKGAVVLYNSREDLPYLGLLATQSPYLPILGDNDFGGLQGQYLTNIPPDPWGKNYKLDPYAGFVYSDGPDSQTVSDDIREYYIRDLAMRKIEWEDLDNDRKVSQNDLIYLRFNKSVSYSGPNNMAPEFDVWENNQRVATLVFSIDFDASLSATGYNANTMATITTMVCRVAGDNKVVLGQHAVSISTTQADPLAARKHFSEVVYDRGNSIPTSGIIRTKVELNSSNQPLRYIVVTAPIKITPKS